MLFHVITVDGVVDSVINLNTAGKAKAMTLEEYKKFKSFHNEEWSIMTHVNGVKYLRLTGQNVEYVINGDNAAQVLNFSTDLLKREREFQELEAELSNLSWRNVLDVKNYYGHISDFAEMAIRVGYKFICWNDLIYKVESNGRTINTNLSVKEIK